jgi:glyoxylase-like metal-dependent hydrolase (beta-lactamase superfamily II)
MMQPCTLHKVSEHVWWFTPESRTDRASLGLVVGENASLMLEAGASPAHTKQFLQALTDAGLPQPDYAVLTHWHWDHSFGISALDVPVFAHHETAQHVKRMMAYDYGDSGLAQLVADGIEFEFIREHIAIEMTDTERKNLKLRLPDITFDNSITFQLGSVTCQVKHVGGDHAADSCVMYIPEDKVLFLGDCIYQTVYEEPRHYTRSKLLPLIDKIENIDAIYFIEGHSDEVIERAQIMKWFSDMRRIYSLIDEHGASNSEAIQSILGEDEDALDFLETILAGYAIQTIKEA